MTQEEKIAAMDKILEMNSRCKSFYIMRSEYGVTSEISVNFKLKANTTTVEYISPTRMELIPAVEAAYAEFSRLIGKLPDFDANRTIEHQPASAPLNDETPF